MQDKWLEVYNEMFLCEAEKKNIKSRQETVSKVKSPEELERLAKISAKTYVKNKLAKKLFKEKYTNLTPSQKDRVKQKMKDKSSKSMIEKATDKKVQEKTYHQKEKLERKKASEAKDKAEKKKHLAKAKEYDEKGKAIRKEFELD